MNTTVLKTHGLTKFYGGAAVLDKVSITLHPGKIYGLIGQNGAGKTTLMRLVAGLGLPAVGVIELFGKSGEKSLQEERRRIGCMIDHPSYVPYMTAKENMRYHRIVRGIPNESIEDELLVAVGLKDTGRKKASRFSLGMKQRLGIAISLISSPEFLILDEPINGLDPVGVVEIRKLLLKLCEEQQMTLLVSSHNLPELDQMATDYIIIHEGQIKKTVTHDEQDQQNEKYIRIACTEPERLAVVLEKKLGTTNFKVMPDNAVHLYDAVGESEKVAKILHYNSIIVTHFSVEGESLEDYFLSVTGGGQNA